jgi:hypothetical protein
MTRTMSNLRHVAELRTLALLCSSKPSERFRYHMTTFYLLPLNLPKDRSRHVLYSELAMLYSDVQDGKMTLPSTHLVLLHPCWWCSLSMAGCPVSWWKEQLLVPLSSVPPYFQACRSYSAQHYACKTLYQSPFAVIDFWWYFLLGIMHFVCLILQCMCQFLCKSIAVQWNCLQSKGAPQ